MAATLGKAYIEIIGDVSKFGTGLRNNLAKAFGVVSLGAVAAAASAKLLGLAGSLVQLSGSLVALPAAAFVAGASIAGLVVAVQGLGDAFGAALSGDAAKFEKALQNLSPLAQQLAREFQGVVPALKSIKFAAQDAFTGQLLGQIKATVDVVAGPLSAGLAKVAEQYGLAGKAALGFVQDSATIGFLNEVFDVASGALANVFASIQPVLAGFREIGIVALPLILRMSEAIGGAATRFGEFLQRFALSGEAAAALDTAVQILGQLGTLLLNLLSILNTVFQTAAATASGGFLTSLVTATTAVREFLATAEGSAALTNLFQALGVIAAGLSIVFQGLLSIIAAIGPSLLTILQAVVGPLQALVVGLVPAMQAIAPALANAFGGLAQGVAALGPTLPLLGTAIAGILNLIAPLLPLVVALITPFGVVATVITKLADALKPITDVLGPALMPVINAIVAALIPLAEILVSVIGALAGPLASILQAVSLLLQPILALLGPILQVLGLFVQLIVEAGLAPLLKLIADALVFLLQPLQLLIPPLNEFSKFLETADFGKFGEQLRTGFLKGLQAIGEFAVKALEFVAGLPERFVGFLKSLPERLLNLLKAAFDAALFAIGVGIGLLIFEVTTLPDLIINAVLSLKDKLFAFLGEVFEGAKQLVANAIDFMIEFVRNFPENVLLAITVLGSILGEFFSNMLETAKQNVIDGFTAIVDFIKSVPDRVVALIGTFIEAGKRLIAGFFDGFKSGFGIGEIAGSIVDKIKGFVNSVITRINDGIAAIDDKLPGDLPRIPLLAEGDVIRKPTLAVLGEAGPEAVIPLTKPRRAAEILAESGLAGIVGGSGHLVLVRVFLGDREITDIVRVEVEDQLDDVAEEIANGPRTGAGVS